MVFGQISKKPRDLTQELNALWEVTKELPRGSVVEYSTIEIATKIKKNAKGWTTLIKQWKRRMARERGIWIEAVSGVGYRLLTVEDQAKRKSERIERSAMKKIREAAECVGCIPENELDDYGKRFQVARVDQLAAQAELQKKQKAQRQSWLSNQETLPRLINGQK